MMKKITLIALMAIFCLGGMAQQKKGTVRKTTAKGKTTAINYTARGELGLFDLRGPVKECVWTTKDRTRKLGFDHNGMWTSDDGRKPGANYGDMVKRDNKGRIIQIGDGEETGELFTYNGNGLMTKHVTVYMDGRDVATYSYNSKGECTRESFSYGDMYGSGKNAAIFTILSRDSQGNWTKRKTQNGNVETRAITYYDTTDTSSNTSTSSSEQQANNADMLVYIDNEIANAKKKVQENPTAEAYYQLANLYSYKYTKLSGESEKKECLKEADNIYAKIISNFPEEAAQAYLDHGSIQKIFNPDINAGAAKPFYEKYMEMIEPKIKAKSYSDEEKSGYLLACSYMEEYYMAKSDFKQLKKYLLKRDAVEPGSEYVKNMLNTLKDY